MNRILKRPMFRIGGSAGTGITSGLDRKPFQNGSDPTTMIPQLGSLPRNTINQPTRTPTGIGFGTIPGFLTGLGLNLVSAPPRGRGLTGLLATVGDAAKEPFGQFQEAKFKEKQAEDKFAKDLELALAKPKKQTLRQAVNNKTGERGFYTDTEIMNNPNLVPPDNRMAFRFNADTNTFEQIPISDIERGKEDEAKARALGTQYNILTALTKDMQKRLPGTATGFTGNFFQFLEGAADQFRQLGSSYGIANGLTEDFDDSKIDEYLESKGATKLASNYATMKGSVINLGYALAKIAEPDNPRLSEGDIIRQLNRINFGASRKIFKDSLDQILKEENIRASAEIKGLKLNPDNFIGIKKEEKKQEDKKDEDFDPLGIL